MRRPAFRPDGVSLMRLLLIAVSLPLLLAPGCAVLTPRTSALRQIHHSYRSEFMAHMPTSVPSPRSNQSGRLPVKDTESAFVETLHRIRQYRLNYDGATVENAHLLVLEGMIYLQTGQFDRARELEADILQTVDNLRGKRGTWTRDSLFAAHFKYLLAGWSAAIQLSGREIEPILSGAAEGIDKSLAHLREKTPGRNGLPEKAEGADEDQALLYIATSGAIFYDHVGRLLSFDDEKNIKLKCEKATQLMTPYLSENERRLAIAGVYEAAPKHRLRYLEWYHFFASGECAQARR